MSIEKNDRIGQILNLRTKHAERARDNEDIAWARAQDARSKHLDAIRHNARLGALVYAIDEIRQLANTWEDAASEYSALTSIVNNAVEKVYRENAALLNDLAFRLLSEVDES